MAESWNEWLSGSPERRLRYADEQRKRAEDIRAKPMYQALGRMTDRPLEMNGEVMDPRESRMAMMQDSLMSPVDQNEAADLSKATADYALDFGGRMRDTGLTALAKAYAGEYGDAAGLAGRSVVAGLYPPAGAGMRGQPDDWRAAAEKNGVPASHILAMDVATDPENWITAPVRGPMAFVAPGVAMRFGGAAVSRADDALRAMSKVRPAPTYLIDEAGDTIRRLRGAVAP